MGTWRNVQLMGASGQSKYPTPFPSSGSGPLSECRLGTLDSSTPAQNGRGFVNLIGVGL